MLSDGVGMRKGGSPDRPLVPPVPSPFTSVLYSAERGLPRRQKLRAPMHAVNIGKRPGRLRASQVGNSRRHVANSNLFSAMEVIAEWRAKFSESPEHPRRGRNDLGLRDGSDVCDPSAPVMLDAHIDHVAIAVRRYEAAIPFFVDALGGAFLFGGENAAQGFRWAQFRFPNGGKI